MLRRKSKTVIALRYLTNKFLDIVEEVGTNSWKNREFLFCPTLVTRQKTFFYISLPSSKLTISLISIFKHYAIDITDPNSMQDACHMNLVIDRRPRLPLSLCGSVEEHRSVESESLRFDSSWGLRIFLCPTLVTRWKTSFFKTEDCSLSFAQSPIQSLNNNPDPGSQRTEIK